MGGDNYLVREMLSGPRSGSRRKNLLRNLGLSIVSNRFHAEITIILCIVT